MDLKALAIITDGYPCNLDPTLYPFVQEFAHAVAHRNVRVKVIAPMPVHVAWRSRDPLRYRESARNGASVEVYRPRFLSLSNKPVWRWNTAQWGHASFRRAAARAFQQFRGEKPDAVYGHFLYSGGEAAVRLGLQHEIPAFPMVGEGLLVTMDPFGVERGRRHFAGARAFMANSSQLGRLLHEVLGVDQSRIGVFPNGVDHRIFRPQDRHTMRLKLGLPEDQFLVICVAKQDWYKGPLRVGEAIDGLEGVGGIFLGAGTHPPKARNILVNRSVPHVEVPDWLAAADVFVLPTAWEGCCNALIEAMACGLPVISALGEFNDDILNEQVAIRVDPMHIQAIRAAIVQLRDDPTLRSSMAAAAGVWAKRFDVDARAQGMLEFMDHWAKR